MSSLNVIEAAASWRDRALQDDLALFSDEPIWTMVNLRALWVALTKDRSDLRRLESLGEQLQGVDPAVVRLTAELFWVMYLAAGPACIGHNRKTDIVRTVYEWSGLSLSPNHPLLMEASEPLEGGPGLLFSARRSEELLFLIKAAVGAKKRGAAERRALFCNAWETGRMLDAAAGDENPQLNHVLRYLLFPEHYEPIFTRRDKRRIVESFSGIPRKETRRWPATRLDEELGSIRKQLEELNDEQALSFLREPLASTWRHGSTRKDVASAEQRFWVEKTPLTSRPDRQNEPDGVGHALWVPRQAPGSERGATLIREVEPGDLIFHFTDNAGITGISRVQGEIEEDFVCPGGSPWAGEPGIRIQLADLAEVTPMLGKSTLLLGQKYANELRRLADRHPTLFFNRQLTLNQGCYLSEAPADLIRIFDEAYRQGSNRHLPHVLLPDREDLPGLFQELKAERVRHPLAQILSGPTGTGKTYTAMLRAVEICDRGAPANHERLIARYRELQSEGRIRLVTFHPSFGYGDFIERADRRVTRDPETGETVVIDTIRPGVFKAMAEQAAAAAMPNEPQVDLTESTLWKVTPLAEDGEDADELYRDLVRGGMLACPVGRNIDFSGCETRGAIQALLEKKTGRASHDEAVSAIDQLVNQMRVGDLAILVDNHAAVRAVGRVAGDYAPESPSGQHRWSQIRPVAWVPPPAEPQPWSRFARKAFLSRPLYRIDPSLMKMDQLSELTEQPPAVRNYVLVIDEIGRGDVASIFGELVTLIEPDKRSGGANPLAVTLPLSGEPFAVPDNLYIIGTLNSSDPVDPQSSDILQRRFEFDERCPEASLIRGDDQLGTIPDGEGGRIDLRALMMTINRRIEYLAGREHRLGQGYFMPIHSYDDLLAAVRSRILPHLRGLFDDDWRKIQTIFRDVLQDGRPNLPQVIGHEAFSSEGMLGCDLDDPATRFWVSADRDLSAEAFRKIYADR